MIPIPPWSDEYREVAYKATRLYPGVVGEVLYQEILALRELRWLGPDSRSARLYREIVAMDEPASVVQR
jgi:hypothetical protein